MEFAVATNNPHKLEEIQRILRRLGHTGLSMAQLGLDIEPEETGATFAENAMIKAEVICAASGRPTIADDSGLAVDALDGAPGVYSARYAGAQHDSEDNKKKLLAALRDVPKEKRTGRFVSAVALVLPGGASLQTLGTCEGVIGFEERGHGGFGYDPLFYVDGRSFAEMTDGEKDSMSHRARALAEFGEKLPGFLAENT